MPLVVNCAGCDRPINDQYVFNVLERPWHEACIQCSDCKLCLTERCFSRDGKLYCKNDFFRRFAPKCAGCSQVIMPSDLVRRARDKVYHVNCFACCICRKPIGTGEQLFFIDEYKFMCKQDYVHNKSLVQDEMDEDQCLLKSPINSSQMNLYDSSSSSVSSTGSDQRNLKFLQNHHSMHHMHPLDSISSSSSSPSLLKQDLNQNENTTFHPSNTSTPPLGKQNTSSSQIYLDHAAEKENLLINTSNDSSTDYMHMTSNFHMNHMNTHNIHNSQPFYPDFIDSDKEENNNSDDELIDDEDEDVDDDDEDDDGNGDRTHGSNGKSSSSSKDDSSNLNGKKRGPRTTIKAKQLEMLKSAFAATPKPTRHIREQLAQETGLNMRVIQVWFQNRRSKERRMKQLSAMGNRRHYYRNSAAAAAAARLQTQQNLPSNGQSLTLPIQTPQMTSSLGAAQNQRPAYDIDQNEFSAPNTNQTNYMNHTTDFYGNNNSYEFMVQNNNDNIMPRAYDSVMNPVMENWNMI